MTRQRALTRGIAASLLTLAAGGVLGGCGQHSSGDTDKAATGHAQGSQVAPARPGQPLSVSKHRFKKSKPGCTGKSCPFIEARWVSFPQAPGLSAKVETALTQLAGSKQTSLKALAKTYLQQAEPRWNLYVQAEVARQQPSLVTVQLDTVNYTGGAHGDPQTRYINWDRLQQRVLTLADILQPGKTSALWQAAQIQYRAWRISNHLDDEESRKIWKFSHTDNFMLTDAGLVLRYQAYAIGPYAMGQPRLLIPYSDLRGILRSRFLPVRGNAH